MNPKNVRAFIEALEALAEQRGIAIDHKLQLNFGSWYEDGSDHDNWVLHVNTDVGSKRAMDFWDEIGQLAFDNNCPHLTTWVGWLMDSEIEKEPTPCE